MVCKTEKGIDAQKRIISEFYNTVADVEANWSLEEIWMNINVTYRYGKYRWFCCKLLESMDTLLLAWHDKQHPYHMACSCTQIFITTYERRSTNCCSVESSSEEPASKPRESWKTNPGREGKRISSSTLCKPRCQRCGQVSTQQKWHCEKRTSLWPLILYSISKTTIFLQSLNLFVLWHKIRARRPQQPPCKQG